MSTGIEEIKLNLGCGKGKISGYVNIDSEYSVRPDLVSDLKMSGVRIFPDGSISEILLFHAIEHIEEKFHETILTDFWRALKPGGSLFISYPEFQKCALNYINNHKGMREFWKNTIYGLQRYPGDYHVALMDSESFILKLLAAGFSDIHIIPEPKEDFNTFVHAKKGTKPLSYEDILQKELFN